MNVGSDGQGEEPAAKQTRGEEEDIETAILPYRGMYNRGSRLATTVSEEAV